MKPLGQCTMTLFEPVLWSPGVTTTEAHVPKPEPVRPRAYAPQQEKPPQRRPSTAREQTRLMQPEKAHTQPKINK